MKDRYTRRKAFDEQAEYFDETAGTYPPEIIDEIIQFSGINDDARILEIGCGTGQATISFAERGYKMTAIELGSNLAALAKKNLAEYPNVEILNMAFEDWPLEAEAFDLVISADAFHWIAPEVGYPKVADAVKKDGTVAFFWIVDRRVDTKLSEAIQQVYQAIAPEVDNPLTGESSSSDFLNSIIHRNFTYAPSLSLPTVRKYPNPETVSAADHIKQLYTYSLHRNVDMDIRKKLYSRVERVINDSGGQFINEQEVMLFLVKKQ